MKGFRNLILAFLVVLIGIGDVVQAFDLQAILLTVGVPEGKVGGILALVGMAFALLRFVTNTSVGQKEPQP